MAAKPKPRRTKKRPHVARSAKRPLHGFGAWKHRSDIDDTAEFARSLRRRVSSRSAFLKDG